MPDFQILQSPPYSPTRCVTCGTSRCDEGFVDLIVEEPLLGYNEQADAVHDPSGTIPTWGHLLQCVLCVRQAAKAAGCLGPDLWADLRADLGVAHDRITDLEAELEHEKANKVVSLADVLAMNAPKPKAEKPKAAA